MEAQEIKSYINRFNALYKKCDDLYRSVARHLNISESGLWILSSLAEEEKPLNQRILGEHLSQPRQTINSAIKNLKSKNIIQLVTLERNQKEKRIVLTEIGEQFVQTNIIPVLNAERAIFKEMGKDESEKLLRLMQKYVGIYDEAIKEILI